jgi:Protein of unknown function (DUF3107)
MEVKIGVQHAPRELSVDTADSAEDVQAALDKALGDNSTLALTDSRGRRVLIPARNIAYVEIGTATAGQVGFRG